MKTYTTIRHTTRNNYARSGMEPKKDSQSSRRDFFKRAGAFGLGVLGLSQLSYLLNSCTAKVHNSLIEQIYDTSVKKNARVSVVKIQSGNVAAAVIEAIEKIGGIGQLTKGKDQIMLKPNLVSEARSMTTKVEVTEALATLMIEAGKQVTIAEGSAAAAGLNHLSNEDYRTKNEQILNALQKKVFDETGYSAMAERMKIPLVNLHTGKMSTIQIPDAHIFDEFTLHESLMQTEMFCSLPMMKTHQLATVTLSMKNLFGIIPGSVYGTVRGSVHDLASQKDKTGTDAVVMDLLKARPIDLALVDASYAMEGNGPAFGHTFPMNLIIAGDNPLAVDMVSSLIMGFDPQKIPTFMWAQRSGMTPFTFNEIEVVGERVETVWKKFTAPRVYPWSLVKKVWGHKTLAAGSRTSILKTHV